MVARATLVGALIVLFAAAAARAQDPARSEGWVVIPVDEYKALRLRAFPPDPPPDPPPVDATLTRVEYDLRADSAASAAAQSASGEARLTVDVLKDGWVRIDVPPGLLVRAARVDGRPVGLIDKPAPHVLLAKPGRVLLSLDIVVPVKTNADAQALSLPASPGAVSRVSLVIPRDDVDVTVTGGVLVERALRADARWVAYGRGGQPLTLTWKRRVQAVRMIEALKWRGGVLQHVGLGEETSPVTATVRVEITQGAASSIDVAVPEGLAINQVSGPFIADWDFRPGPGLSPVEGVLKVNFLEPLNLETSFVISGEARVPRDGNVTVPLVRLPAAERELGGVAVEVLGAGEIRERQPRGLDPADPSDFGEPIRGRESPSMLAFRYRPQAGTSARSLTLDVARYAPQAVLIANVEEARYDALVAEEGKTLVRARYAVRNNQRAFLGVVLPPGATLWSAAVASRPIRPGVSPTGGLLLPLQKGRAGEETPAFTVEVTYVQRTEAWTDKGRTTLTLPALDLPISRTGVVLHHSPRFRLTPEPGAFSVEPDAGPVTDTLREADVAFSSPPPPPPPAAAPVASPDSAPARAEELLSQFRKDTAGKIVAGPLPVRVPFPQLGPSVFLMAQLTAESQAPVLEFTYKRESRW